MRATKCAICGSVERDTLYRGPIRVGRFGQLSKQPHTVWRCAGCGAGYLPETAVDYESSEYRALVDGGAAPEDYHRIHDGEQLERLRMLGTDAIRDRVVLDVGCGAGSFLDLMKGMCRTTIGVEPTHSLRDVVAANGHLAFPYCADVPAAWAGQVDVAVAFSLVEHLQDPLGLLRDVYRLLRPGGRVVVSTPNRRDWLLDVLPEEYGAFFYRLVHVWYFDAASLDSLLRRAGFASPAISCVHRFDVSNAVLWLRDRRPTGLGSLALPPAWTGVFRALLEGEGRADYLYGTGVKG
jgi:SAM-dependent methyltransferase